MAHDPLFSGYVPVIESVKILEDSVHQDVICHVEDVMEKLSEGIPEESP